MEEFIFKIIVSSVFFGILSQALIVPLKTTVDMNAENLYSDGHRLVYVVLDTQHKLIECKVYGDRNAVKHLNIEPDVISPDFITNMIEYCHTTYMDRNTPGNHRLYKRNSLFLFPGTKWCGRNAKATKYNDLGRHEATDKCCRTHDHCDISIRPYKWNYGLFNSAFYTRSHCDCDEQFYNCLKASASPVSADVGNLFFNVLKAKCIKEDYSRKCTQTKGWLWFKRCKKHKIDCTKRTLKFTAARPF